MRTKYDTICYKCGQFTPKGQGHPQRKFGRWYANCLKCMTKKWEKEKNCCSCNYEFVDGDIKTYLKIGHFWEYFCASCSSGLGGQDSLFKTTHSTR